VFRSSVGENKEERELGRLRGRVETAGKLNESSEPKNRVVRELNELDDKSSGRPAGQYVFVEAAPQVISRLIEADEADEADEVEEGAESMGSVAWYFRNGAGQQYSLQQDSSLGFNFDASIDSAPSSAIAGEISEQQRYSDASTSLGSAATGSIISEPGESDMIEKSKQEKAEQPLVQQGEADQYLRATSGKEPKTVRVLFFLPSSE